MTHTQKYQGQVNGHREKSYRAYHDALMARLEGDVGLLFLLHAILHFRWDHQPLRNGWQRYWNEDKRASDAERQANPDFDHDYWDRTWNMREKARRVIEGREPWPRDFVPWKQRRETLYYLGIGKRPPWLDCDDDPTPFAARLRTRPAQRLKRLERKLAKVRAQ